MSVRIDWLSMTLPIENIVSVSPDTMKPEVRSMVRDHYPHVTDWLASYSDMIETGGNRIFDRGFRSATGGFTIFQRTGRPFSLIEFSGTGVQELREAGLHYKFTCLHWERLTRLDIAVDYETKVTPQEFAICRNNDRFEHYCDIHSETGDTYYVGSKKSERFVRIYRYNEPHPRSHLLRCEFQLKSTYAKNFAYMMKTNTLRELQASLHRSFGFTHPLVDTINAAKPVKAPRAGAKGGTERWLFAQVLPAIEKLVENGETDIVALFSKRVYDLYMDYLIKKENNHYGKENLCPDAD